MFYVAEAFLLEKGLSFSKHATVIAAFGQHFVKTGLVPKEFQLYLTEGASARNVSDYDIGPVLGEEETAEQIVRAQAFADLGRRMLGKPD